MFTRVKKLAGSAPRRAFGAQAAKNQFTVTKNALTEGARSRFGNGVPSHVLYIATTVANEMVMANTFCIELSGAALDGHLTDQARLNKIAQIIVNRSARGAGIDAIDGGEDFGSGGMAVGLHQEVHDRVALWRATQTAAFQGPFDRGGVHERN
jgi:hypothetical protein